MNQLVTDFGLTNIELKKSDVYLKIVAPEGIIELNYDFKYGKYTNLFTVFNIRINKEYQRKGLFTQIIKTLHQFGPVMISDVTTIECYLFVAKNEFVRLPDNPNKTVDFILE